MITLLTIQRKKYQAGNFIFIGTNACTNCSESIDNKGKIDFVSGSDSHEIRIQQRRSVITYDK
jgi:hypothetical protein